MTDNNTYYTPSIEEFCVGFEFETAYGGNLNEWHKDVFTEDDFRQGRTSTHETYRVRHLCHEDIVGCGWVNFGRDNLGENEEAFTICGDKVDLYYNYSNHWAHIVTGKEFGRGNQYLFQGMIRNRSELLRIMKMVGIEK